MHPIFYAIIGVVLILILGPTILGDSTPIPETSEKVKKIHAAVDVETLLKSSKYVVVDFYADWCPPCRAIAPLFSKLADDHAKPGKLAFAKVNTDHVKEVAVKYGISAMPTFLFFEDGKPASIAAGGKEGVEMVRGADAGALKRVVQELGRRVESL